LVKEHPLHKRIFSTAYFISLLYRASASGSEDEEERKTFFDFKKMKELPPLKM